MSFAKSTSTPLSQVDDTDLVIRALRQDAKAFEQLLNRHLTPVYNLLYRITQNADLAEELAQETFVKAYRNLKSFDPVRPFRPWILRIASNTAFSALRKQGRTVSLDALTEDGHWNEAHHQPADDVATSLERKLSAEEALRALSRLDAKYREVLVLRYQNELSYEEIAEALDIPLNTVRTWLRRGLERLRHEVDCLEIKEMA